jgi:V8-like Glu-specific endopeptidase
MNKGVLASHALVLALSSTLLACVAAVDSDAIDRDESNETQRPIIDGTTASAYPEAVLVDMKQGGQVTSICSGALIAPRVVLTAGHCVHGFDGWNIKAPFASGQTASSTSGATFDWKNDGEFVDPDQHDVGLVFLSKDITLTSYPKIAKAGLVSGTKIVNVGRIRNGVASYTKLYVSTPIAVKSGTQYGFPFDYAAPEMIESGDSGGPDLLPGAAPHTVVAVNSGSGGGTEVLARVDLVASWIEQQIAAHPGSGSAGGGTTPAACSHSLCTAGSALKDGCNSCVSTICAGDPYCCNNGWDSQCISEVSSMCGVSTCSN